MARSIGISGPWERPRLPWTDSNRHWADFKSSEPRLYPQAVLVARHKGLVTASGVAVASRCRKFGCGLAADWSGHYRVVADSTSRHQAG